MFPRYHSYAPPRMKEGGSLCKDMYGNTIQCPPGYTSGSVVYATNQGATSDHTRVVINSPLGNKTLGNFPNKVVGNVGPRKEIPGEMILNTTGKLLDPTGISSWGDAGTAIGEAIDNPNLLNILGASMETLGALPLVHYLGATAKLPKTAKVISEAEKTSKLKKVLKGVGTTAKWVSGEPIVAGIDKITGAANALEDANKIHNDFKKYKQVEVRNRQEPIFAIIPMYTERDNIPERNNNIMVYFKGAYGVSSGSIEPIIDIEKLAIK